MTRRQPTGAHGVRTDTDVKNAAKSAHKRVTCGLDGCLQSRGKVGESNVLAKGVT